MCVAESHRTHFEYWGLWSLDFVKVTDSPLTFEAIGLSRLMGVFHWDYLVSNSGFFKGHEQCSRGNHPVVGLYGFLDALPILSSLSVMTSITNKFVQCIIWNLASEGLHLAAFEIRLLFFTN